MMASVWEQVLAFMELGGDVLIIIGVLTFFMWTLILERIWYFKGEHKRRISAAMNAWESRQERVSWHARQIREALVSQVDGSMNRSLSLIKTCVALCPLLGLLGTVTGMIQVFDVMSIAGSGNARSMAGGVSAATIPTMAGMVAALSGIVGDTYLTQKYKSEKAHLEDHLTMDH